MSGSKNRDHIVMFIKHKEAVALFSEHSIKSNFSASVLFSAFANIFSLCSAQGTFTYVFPFSVTTTQESRHAHFHPIDESGNSSSL